MSSTPRPEPQPQEPDIGQRTARGFVWLFSQGIGEKVVTLAGQVALARILTKDAFQLVALTYTVTMFAGLLQQAGIGQVLMTRQARFHLWATPAFWMSLFLGLVTGALTAALAPVAAAFYNAPELRGLLLVAALTLPINSLNIVPDTKLRSQLRFKFLAGLGMLTVLCTTVLSVILALMSYGAYSFIVPPVIVGIVRVGLTWWWARPTVHLSPQFRRWKHLVSDSIFVLIGLIACVATWQAAPAILGRLYPTLTAAGIFYFAWNLSDQSQRLLVNNVTSVLFPALSTMQGDALRQRAALLRTVRALLLIGTPVCLMQAVLAGPVIRLVFSTRWNEAAPATAALCVGMIARLASGPSDSMFMAQARYSTYMRLSLVYAFFFIAIVAGAAWIGGPSNAEVATPIAAGACLFLLGPVALRVALGPNGWIDVARVYSLPVLSGLAAFTPGFFLVNTFPRTPSGDFAAILSTGAICGTLSLALLWTFARPDMLEILRRVSAVIRGRRRAKPGHCTNCGFDVSGSPAATCPECGRTILGP